MPELDRQIVDRLTSGVMAVNTDGIVLQYNPAACRYLGLKPEQLEDHAGLTEITVARPLLAVMKVVLNTGEALERQALKLDLPEGGTREIGLSASPLGPPETPTGVVFLFTDMTERLEQERIDEMNRRLATLGELTAGVVHELRNPTTIIGGMAEILLRKLGEDEECYASAKTILNEARQIEKVVSHFLGMARPFDLTIASCSVTDIADRARQMSEMRAKERNVSLQCTIDPDLPALHADVQYMAQAIANLLNNAVDAAPEGGAVVLHIRKANDDILFDVADNGPGVHVEEGENLFAPFVTNKEGGTGLGLSIVHRIVTGHGGAVGYRNRDEGGACFTISIPLRG